MDIEGFRKAGYAAVDSICEYYATLQNRPVSAQVEPGFLARQLPSSAPEDGEPWSQIEQDYQKIIMPGITHWQHPNFYGYFPCNASFEGALADLYTAAISNPGFNWSCSPSVTELEILMMDWIANMLGLDESFLSTSSSGKGGGIILGSASEVALTVAIAARERCISVLHAREPAASDQINDGDAAEWRAGLTAKLVMYGTTQTHSVGAKAALILGLEFRALPVLRQDNYALRGVTLQRALEEDAARGKVPFMLIATLGTTSSGAIDNLTEIMPIANNHSTLWVHIDAAYAGVALSLPERREELHLDAINSTQGVDSFSTNLHKWGLVQFDCSPLLVRDRGHLARALSITPEYLRTKTGDAGSVLDLRNLQISLGRRFRSLKVWFVLRSFGLNGFRNHLRSCIDLAHIFEDKIRTDDRHGLFELVAPPRCALVVFRIRPPTDSSNGVSTSSDIDLDVLNRQFWDDLEKLSEHFVLTQTTLPDVGFCIRFVVGSPQTKAEHVEKTWQLISQTAHQTWTRFTSTQTVLN